MGLFNKKNSFAQESQMADKEVISSIIDSEMVIKGELVFEGKARIDGSIEGNIQGEHLILSESGKITGDIQVASFVCHGALEGNVQASLVAAHTSCRIQGCIKSKTLSVEPGAEINGELKITSKELRLVDPRDALKTANG
ncbi:MAG: polymer-forming cytoskeletal protein [Desulfocapsa sp.]|nr:polymer-forming cytoskeletal protein [Desulfocapsa sp.]